MQIGLEREVRDTNSMEQRMGEEKVITVHCA
jgi:hypothetical protein